MQVTTDPESYLPLKPAAFHILLALVDAERHGYGIMQEVQTRSHGGIKLAPGTLYGTIKRLLADELIAESEARPDLLLDDRPILDDSESPASNFNSGVNPKSKIQNPKSFDERRRYYCLTELGRKVITLEAQRLADLVNMASAKKLLDGSVVGGNF